MDQFCKLRAQLARLYPDLDLREREPMSRHTTFRIGGPVPLMALPATEEQLAGCIRAAVEAGVRLVVIGNGSNLLTADEGAEVFAVGTASFHQIEQTGPLELTAQAGALLSRLALFGADRGLSGLEFAQGIPGSLGGAVTMNAGAYGGEMVRVVTRTRYLTRQGEVGELTGEEHRFSYRHSVFSDRDWVVLSSTMTLKEGDPAAIRAEISRLGGQRRSKQPLEYPSAGSMFKRPLGYYAAALIEQCGLKGLSVGGAQVSEKHAGFVVNRSGATCGDVLALVAQVRERVREQTGVELEMEVKVLN